MRTTRAFPLYGSSLLDLKQRKWTTQLVKSPDWGSVAIGLFLLATLVGCAKEEPKAKPSPPDVTVADVVQQDVPVYGEWVAQLNGPVNAEITPKVQGYLLQQNYQNGFFVKKGQLLFTLDPRQYEAEVDQAKAQVGTAEANLAKANNDVARDTPLAAQKAIAQRDLDTDLTTQQAMQSQLQAAKASQANAELNLTWTKVYSPIDGIAGVSNSQIGDLVGTSTKMVTVSQVNPIWAYFNPSESLFLKFAPEVTAFITGRLPRGSRPQMPVELIQANDIPYSAKGRIIYVNRQVGTGTGTIQMAAEFPNPQAVLRPGGYGRVRIKVADNGNALLVPQPAVIEVQSDYMIVVLSPENKAMFRPVKVGERVGPNWVITEGLKPGEKVVVEGIERLSLAVAAMPQLAKEGIPVNPKPYVPVAAIGGGN
ncbi:efflux RND transporter periplasmic adaptor subunit [Alloacidobacterium dinghuense]|uniref:Efflux RND transporter periplasmic adaptor subunit n=1 Tax=Alloacidobacterium dinghuense TaxID=2763107 RepID=A0A7G8BJJ0_9BACT|nr:efflux RND transporter periplasmic adaptor subunit [Alloacidobacterium dinghuense]QNI32710.1 efflux RND transporter periplasmic adaptor subunit [Alloacidobacterium dinghuense]